MPIYSPVGYLDITNATLRTSNLEAQNFRLNGGNIYVTSELTTNELLNLDNVVNAGNAASDTVQFTNSTTGFIVDSNIVVAGNVTAAFLHGDASNVTAVPAAQITGTLAVANGGTGTTTSTGTGSVVLSDAPTFTGDVTFDTNTLFVDSVNDRVGVGTSTPEATLHVVGNAYVSSNLEVGTANLFVDTVNSRVGIGTTSPEGQLHISSGTSGDCVLILEADTDNNFEGDNPRIEFWQDGGVAESAIRQSDNYLDIMNSVTTLSGIRFFTGDVTSGYTNAVERMRIDPSGNVGIGTTTPNETLSVYKEDTTAAGQTKISSITGVFSGSDATGGNINNTGLYINLDSSATGGTATSTEEHRVWGIDVDIDVTGDSDDIRGGRFLVRSELAANGSDRTSIIYGIDAQGQHNGSAPNTNIIGVNARSFKDSNSTGLTDTMIGVDAENEINAGTCTDAYGVRSQLDRNGGAVTNSYLFYGEHLGSTTTITNNYGLYVTSADKHYLEGNVGIGTTSPETALDVSGTVKSTHVSLGSPLNPTIGGNWVSIVNGTYDGAIGDEYPNPEGGILFTNRSSGNTFPWGYYMGVVKDVASTSNTSTRFDIGKSLNLNTNGGTGGTDTLTPYLTIDDGNVGIGTTNPQGQLHISSGTSGDCVMILQADTDNNNEGDNPRIEFWQDGSLQESAIVQGNNTLDIMNSVSSDAGIVFHTGTVTGYTNAVERMRINASGNVGIGTTSPSYKLEVSGDIYASGNVTAYSDRRAKSNIEKIQNPLDKIDKISGYTYTMKVDVPEKEKRFTGLIAQEVLEILPEAVMGSEENHYSLAYGNMAGLLVEAIKELSSELKTLKQKIS